jgi:predicted transcriptional regulator
MKTAVSIPDDIFRSAERLAKRLGISRSELYATALQQLVEEQNNQSLSNRIDKALEGLDTRPDPVLVKMSARTLKRELRDDQW